MITVLLLFSAFLAINARSIKENCEINIDYRKGDLTSPQPLILTNNAKPEFVLPNNQKYLIIPSNSSIVLSCPGSKNSLENFNKSSINAICLRNKQFLVDTEIYNFNAFKCKTIAKETVKKLRAKCLDGHQRYDIGFQHEKHFLKQVEICRDESTYRTYYVKHKIVKEIMGFQSSYPRPYWRHSPYYNPYNMNQVYKSSSQLLSVETIVGSAELASNYVRPSVQSLNRGHLAAKADFVYGSQQSATFWLMNAEPQWASFNAGNWLKIENAIRRYATEYGVDLDVYSGVHGISSLADIEGKLQPLYLHAAGDERAFAVPRFFWKVVHDASNNRALAFVGLNEPHAAEITKDMYLCPDVGGKEVDAWVGWKPDDINKGVSYTCEVEELRKAIPTVPSLGEVSVISLSN